MVPTELTEAELCACKSRSTLYPDLSLRSHMSWAGYLLFLQAPVPGVSSEELGLVKYLYLPSVTSYSFDNWSLVVWEIVCAICVNARPGSEIRKACPGCRPNWALVLRFEWRSVSTWCCCLGRFYDTDCVGRNGSLGTTLRWNSQEYHPPAVCSLITGMPM